MTLGGVASAFRRGELASVPQIPPGDLLSVELSSSFQSHSVVRLDAAVIELSIARRLSLSAVLGYPLAGVLVGPQVVGDPPATEKIERFRAFDEHRPAEQHPDEAALIQSAQWAAVELEALFEATVDSGGRERAGD